ncbi:hypothetical protein [Fibrobacter sp. UWB3]|uniref:hypothetical protein n=1 Tax=Fibrobacter sp. UWB3 TaxID=1964357 RepID=UPI000B527A75|nr:hypothetical protein [Fibrobacter sp. UWB3]OWV22055.1 hypothetical protein B7991_03590 [Fibrobacter sp. UWB3]
MRKSNSSAIGLLAFVLMLSLVFPAAALSSPGDPLTWRDSTWDYRSEDSADIKSEIEPAKIFGVASLTLIAYGAAYGFVFEKGWWDDERTHFHFENDFDYALNLDKFGHFAAGVVLGEFFYEGYHWAGASEFQSYLFAGLSALATHIAIDVKDGFAPTWGFSIFDVLSGGLGGFLPMAERYVPLFKYIDLKWSYWINSNAYYDSNHAASGGVFTDDYVNQTFWLSVKPYRLLPESARKYYPSWLAIAVGLSIDEKVFTKEPHPRREVYVALDYDLEAFRPQSRFARFAIKMLNYFKLPAPTIQVYPEFHWYLLYPIKF